eukprot:403350540
MGQDWNTRVLQGCFQTKCDYIIISWTPPNNNGDLITKYLVEVQDKDAPNAWSSPATCVGTSATVLATASCQVPMDTLTSSTYNYDFDNVVLVRVGSENGFSLVTDTIVYTYNIDGAKIRQIPIAMAQPLIPAYTDTYINVTWSALTGADAGNSPITSYALYWNAGAVGVTTATTEVTEALITSYQFTSIVGGRTYYFAVKAKNVYGYGDLSSTNSITAIDIPGKMQIPIVEIATNVLNVKITIAEPDTHSSPIVEYDFQVRKLDGTFGALACAESFADVKQFLICTVTMSSIRTTTSLAVDQPIRVKVRARNGKGVAGWGAYSEMNSAGALIQDVPAKMSPPSIVSASVTTTAIPLTWSVPSGAAAGGTGLLILSYELQYSTDGSTWTPIVATITTNSYTHTVTPGSSYLYQIRATNDYGQQSLWSESTATATVANAKPSAPTAPAITQDGINVVIKWALPTTNHATITSYRIKIQPRDTLTNTLSTTYIENATLCDGSLSTVYASRQCIIPMSSLLGFPYYLKLGDPIIAKVTASNVRGESDSSPENAASIYIQTVPGEMAKPTRLTSSLSSRFELSWSAPTVTGGSSILSYFLEWDAGTSGATWSEIVGYSPLSTLTTYSVTGGTTGLTPGATYGFRLTAYNLFGWGKTGTPEYFKAASKPSVITSVSTSIDSTTGNLVISWTPPNNNGDLITKYLVEVQDKDPPNAWSSPATCVGTSATVLATASCQVPMDTLTSSTYNYDFDNVVLVRVGSENGFSLVTDTIVYTYNIDGAKIRQIPIAMAQPLIPAYTDTYINVTWSALTGADAGNSPITSYALYWNAGAVGVTTATTEVTEALITSYQFTSIVGGRTYYFAVKAKNVYGYGDLSSTNSITAIDIPGKMQIPIVEIATNVLNVKITIAEPDTHSSPIVEYDFQVRKLDGTFGALACAESFADVKQYLICTVTMSSIRTITSLAVDQPIRVKVRARNGKGVAGWGAYSEINNFGATIQNIPTKMSGVSFDADLSTSTKLYLTWNAVTSGINKGGSDLTILGYDLWWNQGPSINSFTQLTYTSNTYFNLESLTKNTNYQFKIATENVYGLSTYSDIVTITTTSPPNKPDVPIIIAENLNVKITWQLPSNNGYPVTQYQVIIETLTQNVFIERTALCNGALNAVFSSRECIISMTALRLDPFFLPYQRLIRAQVRAYSSEGWSEYSDANSGTSPLVETEPAKMSQPTDGPLTNNTYIDLAWTAPDNGGSTLLTYSLYWNDGDNIDPIVYVPLVGSLSTPYQSLYYQFSSGINSGVEYKFKIKAINKWGDGEFSEPVSITAAFKPGQILTPVRTDITSATGDVILEWDLPDQRGDPIEYYTVLILSNDGNFREDLTNCDGNQPAIVNFRTCTIPMSTLRDSPFSLAFDALIEVKVYAINSYGNNTASPLNTDGARIRQKPNKMGTPYFTARNDASITMNWAAQYGTQAGNSDILYYTFYWDSGSTTTFTVLQNSTQTSKVISGLASKTNYKFYITSTNIYGTSLDSDIVTVKTLAKPEKMSPVSINQVNMNAVISWAYPTDNLASILEYEIKIYNPIQDTYTIDTVNCDGSITAIRDARECSIPIWDLIDNFEYKVGDTIKAQIRARNVIDWSVISDPGSSGATIETEPVDMAAPTLTSQTNTQIVVGFSLVSSTPENGGATVTSYEVDYKLSTDSTWIFAAPSVTAGSKTITGLIPGSTYHVAVRAVNVHGQSDSTNYLTVTMFKKADAPTNVVVAESANGLGVDISWTDPTNLNGGTITAYKVEIQNDDLTTQWNEYTTTCNAAVDPVLAARKCTITYQVLRGTGFNYDYGESINVRVSATSTYGTTDYAYNTGGATIETEPVKMAVPLRGSSTDETKIQVDWTALTTLTETGGNTVSKYNLVWDNGSGSDPSLSIVDSLVTTFTTSTTLVTGQKYQFKVRAYNDHGYGEYSNIAEIYAAVEPTASASAPILNSDLVNNEIDITLTGSPYNGGSPVTSYSVYVYSDLTSDFELETTYCSGSTSLTCSIPHTYLSSTYGLTSGDTIRVKYTANNVVGSSSFSPEGTTTI